MPTPAAPPENPKDTEIARLNAEIAELRAQARSDKQEFRERLAKAEPGILRRVRNLFSPVEAGKKLLSLVPLALTGIVLAKVAGKYSPETTAGVMKAFDGIKGGTKDFVVNSGDWLYRKLDQNVLSRQQTPPAISPAQ